MLHDTYFKIRWRWVAASVLAVVVAALTINSVHEWHVSRISERILTSARSHAESGNAAEAKMQYASYLGLISTDANAREEYAQLILSEPRTVENDLTVLQLLDEAVQEGSTRIETRIELIRTAIRLERFKAASAMISALDLKSLKNAELHAMQGLCCFRKGDAIAAKNAYREALKLDGTCSLAWEGLVELTEAEDGLPAALELAERMTSEAPGPEAHSVHAHLLTRSENPTLAGRAFWNASREAGNDLEKATEFADFIMYTVPPTADMDLEMIQAAYDALTAATETTDYMTAARLGDLAHRLDQTDQALVHYQQCLESKPGDAFAVGRITEVLASSGRLSEAHAMLDSMADYNSLVLLRNTLRAGLFAKEGRYTEACDLLEEAVNNSGDARLSEGARFLLVECLWELDEVDRAIIISRELLEQSPDNDAARRLHLASLVRRGDYQEIVKQIPLFRDPAEHLNGSVSMVIDEATSRGHLKSLKTHVDQYRTYYRTSPLPVIFDGYELSDEGKTSEAVSILSKAAAENPDVIEYQIAVEAVSERAALRLRLLDEVSDLTLIADELDRATYIDRMLSEDRLAAEMLMKQFFDLQADSIEPLRLLASLVQRSGQDREALQKLVEGLHDRMAVLFNRHGDAAIPLTARVYADIGWEASAYQLLSGAVRQTDDRQVIETFCEFMGTAAADSAFWYPQVKKALESGELKCVASGREVLLAEVDAIRGDIEAAIARLTKQLKEDRSNETVIASLLRHGSNAEKPPKGLADYGFWLVEKHPNDSEAMLGLCCALRAENRYAESVRWAVTAYAKHQDPRYLVHAACTKWHADDTEAAQGLLQLAMQFGLEPARLHVLDRKVLETLQTEMESLNLIAVR